MNRRLTPHLTRFTLLLSMTLPAGCSHLQRTERAQYDDGARKSEQHMKSPWFGSNVKHGPYRSWHNNGQLMEEGQYEQGRMEGMWTTWDAQGRKRGEHTYRLGERHGTWRSWHPNGQLAKKWAYCRGLQDGLSVSWDPDGKEIGRKRFHMGKAEP